MDHKRLSFFSKEFSSKFFLTVCVKLIPTSFFCLAGYKQRTEGYKRLVARNLLVEVLFGQSSVTDPATEQPVGFNLKIYCSLTSLVEGSVYWLRNPTVCIVKKFAVFIDRGLCCEAPVTSILKSDQSGNSV